MVSTPGERSGNGRPLASLVTARQECGGIRQEYREETTKTLTIGDTAPDFEADSTEGPVRFLVELLLVAGVSWNLMQATAAFRSATWLSRSQRVARVERAPVDQG